MNIKQYLDSASAAYYTGSPFISDEAFDRLAETSNYNTVGTRQHDNVVKHFKRLYSLQKHYEGENKQPLEGIKNISITPKLDGAAISVLYIDGHFVRGLTRGDGIEGQDITDKLIARKDLVPLRINTIGIVQVTGEIVAPKHIENARNYAAGALNLKDIDEFKLRAISFFAYGVYPYFSNTFSQDMQHLENLGFSTVLQGEALNAIYDCDGIVFRVEDNNLFDEMGYTAKFPRGAYALKQRKEAVETTILAVEWNTGRTGKVTPTAILEPVMIGDALVSRATLNNPGFIEMLGLCIGDTVGVVRSGDVIPCIVYKVDA